VTVNGASPAQVVVDDPDQCASLRIGVTSCFPDDLGYPLEVPTMLASEIMTSDVVSVSPEASIAELASLLIARRISGVPVVSSGRVVGMVSEGDLLRRADLGTEHVRSHWLELTIPSDHLAREYVREHSRKVADVMTRDVVAVQHDNDIADIAELLERRGIKRVPVLRDGVLVGIISRANLVQALALRAKDSANDQIPSDLDVRRAISEELAKHRWGGFPSDVNVIVRGGVAHLFGSLRSPAEHQALLVAVETRPGVLEVKDHMTYPGLRPPASEASPDVALPPMTSSRDEP
jgi:predicted transcriptional regulator